MWHTPWYLFVEAIVGLQTWVRWIHATVVALADTVSELCKTSAVQHELIVLHNKQLIDLETRVQALEMQNDRLKPV